MGVFFKLKVELSESDLLKKGLLTLRFWLVRGESLFSRTLKSGLRTLNGPFADTESSFTDIASWE